MEIMKTMIKKNNGNRINLLFISNGNANHYVYIKEASRLFYSSATHAKCKVADKCLCPYCNKFFDVNEFQKHYQTCHKVALEGTQIKMPEPGDTTKFTTHKNKLSNLL